MNNWQQYTKNSKVTGAHEVKLSNNTIKSVYGSIGGKLHDNSHKPINHDDILFFRPKKDWNKFNTLQRHNERLQPLTDELLDEVEFAISDGLGYEWDSKENKKLAKAISLLKKLRYKTELELIKEAQQFLKD